jgi:hypothetical protein
VAPWLVWCSVLAENLAWCQNGTVCLVVLSSLIRKAICGLSAEQDGARFPDGPSVESELRTMARQLLSPTS